MKRIIPLCLVAGLLTVGCSNVKYTSQGAYLGALHEAELGMQALGFQPVATGHETVNETYAFDDEWKNDYVTYDTRQFADSLGNTAAYTVAYRAYKDGMRTVAVAGCEVSHPGDYSLVCGDDGVVQRLNHVPADKEGDSNMNAAGAVTLTIGTCVMLPLILALLFL